MFHLGATAPLDFTYEPERGDAHYMSSFALFVPAAHSHEHRSNKASLYATDFVFNVVHIEHSTICLESERLVVFEFSKFGAVA